jgi:hypothetical protein
MLIPNSEALGICIQTWDASGYSFLKDGTMSSYKLSNCDMAGVYMTTSLLLVHACTVS